MTSGDRASDAPRLVLASASPRRRELLGALGIRFDVVPADADERLPPGIDPEEAARQLSLRKAQIVAARTPLPVLAADTLVVAADGGILGKPSSASEAVAMLSRLSGTTQRVVTGVCLSLDRGSRVACGCDVTRVTMRTLSAAEIEDYAASGEPYGKAGAYAIQERGDRFVTRVEGSWSNVVGLPMELTERLLRAEGVL